MSSFSKKFDFLTEAARDRRLLAMAGLGFSSGLPYLLVYVTQSAWLSEAKVPIETIGLMVEMTIAYKLKFLWAPFLDHYDAPLISRWLGHRRGWIVISQFAVALALAGVAVGDPANRLAWTVAFSLALGFAGATQDVVIDGWRITVAPKERQALMSAYSELGYRVGILFAGAGALLLADRYGWRAAYFCMAALMLPGLIACLMAPEPDSAHRAAPRERPTLATAVFHPIGEMFTRLGPLAIPILLMVAGFRMPGYISNAMAMPLFKTLNYSDAEIATVTKVFGFWVGLGGTFLSSFIVPRFGVMASLLAGTVAASASHLCLAYLAGHGGGFWIFAATVSIDNFAGAFASIVLITYMSSLTSMSMAASQYALLTSLCALPGGVIAGSSGFLIKHIGFEMFFVATSLIGIPVALLCASLWRTHVKAAAEAA